MVIIVIVYMEVVYLNVYNDYIKFIFILMEIFFLYVGLFYRYCFSFFKFEFRYIYFFLGYFIVVSDVNFYLGKCVR